MQLPSISFGTQKKSLTPQSIPQIKLIEGELETAPKFRPSFERSKNLKKALDKLPQEMKQLAIEIANQLNPPLEAESVEKEKGNQGAAAGVKVLFIDPADSFLELRPSGSAESEPFETSGEGEFFVKDDYSDPRWLALEMGSFFEDLLSFSAEDAERIAEAYANQGDGGALEGEYTVENSALELPSPQKKLNKQG